MSDLDDKLREMLYEFVNKRGDGTIAFTKIIAQIKQAFAEEGYRPKSTQKLEKRFGLMTGQEWFDRFRKEYRTLSPNAYAKDRYAKMAAEKSSGINS